MNRTRLLLLALAALVGIGALSSARAADQSLPADRQALDQAIHDYLMNHPEVIVESLRAAEKKMHDEEDAAASAAIGNKQGELLRDPGSPVGGNPKGDVTIVEFFDYHCPYCKQVEPALETLLKEDPKIRIVYKEFPIRAIQETLLEAELFGYERGSFTGASQSRVGRIQAALGGTLFLDEVGELPLMMQVKLLRFLQEREVQRLGSTEVTRVDVRVIAATNSNLDQQVAAGRFRRDLFYRLSVFPIDIPPLRERPEDIVPLAEHFLAEFCRETGVPMKGISQAALEQLLTHTWPGNVRELQHEVERAFILSGEDAELPAFFGRDTRFLSGQPC